MRARLDLAQADVRAGCRRDGPGVGPARAVEHRQRPQVAALVVELEGERVGERAQIGAAVAVDRALGIAGGARGVEQADRVPFVLGARIRRIRGSPAAMKLSYSTPPKRGAPAVSASAMSITIGRLAAAAARAPARWWRETRGRRGSSLASPCSRQKAISGGIEADVDGVEHGTDHRHGVVRLQHGRHVGGQDRHRVAALDAGLGERAAPAAARGHRTRA